MASSGQCGPPIWLRGFLFLCSKSQSGRSTGVCCSFCSSSHNPHARESVPKYSAETRDSTPLIMVRSELAAGTARRSTGVCCPLGSCAHESHTGNPAAARSSVPTYSAEKKYSAPLIMVRSESAVGPADPAARPSVPKYSAEIKHPAYLIMVRSETAAGTAGRSQIASGGSPPAGHLWDC